MNLRILLSTLIILSYLFINPFDVNAYMKYEDAMKYKQENINDIYSIVVNKRDMYGEKNKYREFSFLGKHGVSHSWGSIGDKDTKINFLINYGFERHQEVPYAYFSWKISLEENPQNSFAPKFLKISFVDGFIKNIPLEGWETDEKSITLPGAYYNYGNGYYYHSNDFKYNYYVFNGKVKINSIDLYEMQKHGSIAAVYIDNNIGEVADSSIVHFFYNKDKDAKEKLSRGFTHTLKILEINDSTLLAEKQALEDERLAKLRVEIEKEVREEAEREAIKKEILSKMK